MAYQSYNQKKVIESIFGNKKGYEDEQKKMDESARKAQEYYNNLRNSGRDDVADSLSSMDYNSAKNYIKNNYLGNAYGDANNILNSKKNYSLAEKKRNDYATKAQEFYNSLRDNGDSAVADNLQQRNYDEGNKWVSKYYAKQGKTAIRPYLKNRLAQYGLSERDVDKLITYDNDTGEVFLGGRNLGKPAAEVDGVSYWNENTLEGALGDYISANNLGLTDEKYLDTTKNISLEGAKEHNKSMSKYDDKFFDAYDSTQKYTKEYDPYKSSIGQSIMRLYNANGNEAGYDAIAGSAASNGGNIDSFAAANAKRQQLAFTNAGVAAVLADYNSRIENVKDNLNTLDGYIQSRTNAWSDLRNQNRADYQAAFDNKETALNNAQNRENDNVQNLKTISDITGYVPDDVETRYNNPYLNNDGTVKDVYMTEEFDSNGGFQGMIDRLQTEYDSTDDENRKSEIKREMNMINRARKAKQEQHPEYIKFGVNSVGANPTQQKYEFDKNSNFADKSLNQEYEKWKAENELENKELDASIEASKNSNSRGTSSSGGGGGTSSSGGGDGTKSDKEDKTPTKAERKQMKSWVYDWANNRKKNFEYNENTDELKYVGDGNFDTQVMLVLAALKDVNFNDTQKKRIMNLFSASVIDEAERMLKAGR